MHSAQSPFPAALEARVLAGRAHNEDAAVVAIPQEHAIVQTVDVLAPIVNDAWSFGRIAAANALSDVYAMGGVPWCAMSLAFFPPALAGNDPEETLINILKGSADALLEAGAVSVGGHTVQDDELKYGLAVTGIIDPHRIAKNDGLKPCMTLLLTKPLGTGILATAVKAHWQYAEESEAEIKHWCSRLNSGPGKVIRQLNIKAATDITGFGLGGHALEMAIASNICVEIALSDLPLMPHVLEYARDGLIPAGSHSNRRHCMPETIIDSDADEAIISVVFDAQTSGGILIAVPPDDVNKAKAMLESGGDLAMEIGRTLNPREDGKKLILKM